MSATFCTRNKDLKQKKKSRLDVYIYILGGTEADLELFIWKIIK